MTTKCLTRADLAKFRGTVPPAEEAREALSSARRLVETTRESDPDEGDGEGP